MVSITSPYDTAARGAANLLRNSSNSSLFNSLSGMTAASSGQAVFNALGGNAGETQSIDGILQKQKIDSAKNGIYYNAAARIDYIQQGKLEPKSDWEKVVGYAMNKGLPSVTFIDDTGNVQSQLQSESALAKYNTHQQTRLLETMDQIGVMAQKIQANATNDSWLAKLKGAGNDLYLVANLILQPQKTTPNNWEQTGVLLVNNGQPMKISLDAKGELMSTDQRYDSSVTDLPDSLRTTLLTAIREIPNIIHNGTALKQWELDATNFAQSKVPYYLEIDPITRVISAKENKAENITPKFLKTTPYSDVGDNTDALKQAAQFIKDKKPYFLDIDGTGQVVAKEVTGRTLIGYNAAPTNVLNTSMGTGGILSLFA